MRFSSWVSATARSIDADENFNVTAVDRALKYGVFAVIATLMNLASQEVMVRAYSGSYALYVALFFGTIAGLMSKYWLDKKYIFAFVTRSKRQSITIFTAYTLTGVLTTAVFWGFELSFEYWFGGKLARYLGATIGLAVGYVVKYQLDSRVVFVYAPGRNEIRDQLGRNHLDEGD